MQQSVLSEETPNIPTQQLPLSHLDILFVISFNDMHITHLNKYIKKNSYIGIGLICFLLWASLKTEIY